MHVHKSHVSSRRPNDHVIALMSMASKYRLTVVQYFFAERTFQIQKIKLNFTP